MKERSTHAGNVTTRLLQKVVSLNTSKLYMKEKSTHAGNVTTRLLQRVIFLNTNKFCIKGRNTFVICAAMKQLRITSLRNTRIECIGSQQYNHDAVACNYSRSMVFNILEYSFDGHLWCWQSNWSSQMTNKHHPTLFKCKQCGYIFDKVGKEETHRKTYREVKQNNFDPKSTCI